MPRPTRTRRPLERKPASLAGAAAAAATLGENEAIDSIEVLVPDANIDPALATYDIDHPPPQSLDSLDPLTDFEYHSPSPALPDESQGQEASWPLTPSPPFTQLQSQSASPSPLPLTSDIQPQLPIRWTFEMEEILFLTLLEQVDIGKRADSGFKKEAWISCCNEIKNATGQLVTVGKCKNKVEAMKASWRELNWLKDQSGFGWDENTGLVQAGDQAWKDVIKVSDAVDDLLDS